MLHHIDFSRAQHQYPLPADIPCLPQNDSRYRLLYQAVELWVDLNPFQATRHFRCPARICGGFYPAKAFRDPFSGPLTDGVVLGYIRHKE